MKRAGIARSTPLARGVAEFGHFHAEEWDDAIWTADESVARGMFARLRGKVICECGAEADDAEMTSTEDGEVCPTCADELREEFNATTFAHDRGSPGEDGCEWSGPGSEIVDFDEDALCPKCGAPVTPVVEPATAVTP